MPTGKQIGGGDRGEVKQFSDRSRDRLSWIYSQGPWVSMLTLTYHEEWPSDGRESKRQLQTVLQMLRDKSIHYLWVLEWQSRGVPHYHIWMDRRFPDVPAWQDDGRNSWRNIMRAWLKATGQINDEKACKFGFHQSSYVDWEVKVGNNYAAKYADKQTQKGLPPGVERYGRWWGCSYGVSKPTESVHIPEQTADIAWRTDCTSMRRQVQRAFARFRGKEQKKRNSIKGFRQALRPEWKHNIDRLIRYILGEDVFSIKTESVYKERAHALRLNDDKICQMLNPGYYEKQQRRRELVGPTVILDKHAYSRLARKSRLEITQIIRGEKNTLTNPNQRYMMIDENGKSILAEFVQCYYRNMTSIRSTPLGAIRGAASRLTMLRRTMSNYRSEAAEINTIKTLARMKENEYITIDADLTRILERWTNYTQDARKQNAHQSS